MRVDINDDGLIVGRAQDASGANHAVTWRVNEEVLVLELRVDQTGFEPVIAQCFNAVTQKAVWGFDCDEGQAVRTDRTSVEVLVQRDGTPVEGVAVHFSVEPVEGNGGHVHVDGAPPRPPGRFLSGDSLPREVTETSIADGRVTVQYQTSGVSGQEKLKAEILDEEGEPLGGEGQARMSTIQIGSSLEPMEWDTRFYWFLDRGTTHENGQHNHYTQPASRDTLLKIFKDYFDAIPVDERFQIYDRFPDDPWEVFVITQASLPNGGLFDIPDSEGNLALAESPHATPDRRGL